MNDARPVESVEELYGTWRLVTWTRRLLDTGETVEAFGKAPRGTARPSELRSCVVARLQDAFGVDLSLVAMFERRTVAELAVAITESAALPHRPPMGGRPASGR